MGKLVRLLGQSRGSLGRFGVLRGGSVGGRRVGHHAALGKSALGAPARSDLLFGTDSARIGVLRAMLCRHEENLARLIGGRFQLLGRSDALLRGVLLTGEVLA